MSAHYAAPSSLSSSCLSVNTCLGGLASTGSPGVMHMSVSRATGGQCSGRFCGICDVTNAGSKVCMARLDALDGIFSACKDADCYECPSRCTVSPASPAFSTNESFSAHCAICAVTKAKGPVCMARLDALDGIATVCTDVDCHVCLKGSAVPVHSAVLSAMDGFSSPCQSPTCGICPGRDSGKLCIPSTATSTPADTSEAIEICLSVLAVNEELLSHARSGSFSAFMVSSPSSPAGSASRSDSDAALELASQALAVTEGLLAQGPPGALLAAEEGLDAKLAALAAERAALKAEHGAQCAYQASCSGLSTPALTSPTSFDNNLNSAIARSVVTIGTGTSHLSAPAVASPTLTAEEVADADSEVTFMAEYAARNARIEASVRRQNVLIANIMRGGLSSGSRIPVRAVRLAGPVSPTSTMGARN